MEDDLKVRDILLAFHFDTDLFFGWFAPPFIKVHRAYTRLGRERIRDLLGRKLPGVTGQSLVRFYGMKALPPLPVQGGVD